MNKVILLISILLVATIQAEETNVSLDYASFLKELQRPKLKTWGEGPEVANTTGFATIGWVFAKSEEDLYDMWAAHNDNVKLKGSVAQCLAWSNVSRILVIYNGWHLPMTKKDIRIQHIQNNLENATFGDRFKGNNPGGTYVLLFQYNDSAREVLLSFKDGVFLIENWKGIGVVDIRKAR